MKLFQRLCLAIVVLTVCFIYGILWYGLHRRLRGAFTVTTQDVDFPRPLRESIVPVVRSTLPASIAPSCPLLAEWPKEQQQQEQEGFARLSSKDVYIYSAHYDDRKNSVALIVDVPDRVQDSAINGLKCQLEYSEYSKTVVAPVRYWHRMSPMPEKRRINMVFGCECPKALRGVAPRALGLQVDDAALTDCLPPSLVFIVHHSGHAPTGQHGGLASLNAQVDFAVCVSPFSKDFSNVHALVEFIEVNLLFGAQRFIFYNHSTNYSAVGPALEAYVRDGIVAVVPWPLYQGAVQLVSYYAQQAAFNDCLYRNINTAQHVAVMDLDEFIVPRGSPAMDSWGDIVTRSTCGQSRRPSGIGSWQFRNTFFKLEWPNGRLYANDSVARHIGAQTLLKTWREKLIWGPNARSKYIVRTDTAECLLVHTPMLRADRFECQVPIDEALLQHYRDWGDPYDTAILQVKGTEDNFLAQRHGAEISRRIVARLDAITRRVG